MGKWRLLLGVSVTLVCCALLSVAALAVTRRQGPRKIMKVFRYTGAQQKFIVPRGVRGIHVVVVGGRGGASGSAPGGQHVAKATADIPVRAGEVLFIEVGGNGGNAGPSGNPGFNGGGPAATTTAGNGGGASDVRTVSRPRFDSAQSLASRLIVAAGTGGAGGPGVFANGGAGGSAPRPDGSGGSGEDGVGNNPGGGGGGGISVDGGEGGSSPAGSPGTSGFFGTGGQGADGGDGAAGGGGGGGGWFGGGGGGATDTTSDHGSAGGGGAGSSFFAAQDRHTSLSTDTTGIPRIALTYFAQPISVGSFESEPAVGDTITVQPVRGTVD
jgi:hypothetical protein